jgi:hypothetical protein
LAILLNPNFIHLPAGLGRKKNLVDSINALVKVCRCRKKINKRHIRLCDLLVFPTLISNMAKDIDADISKYLKRAWKTLLDALF